MLRKKVLVVSAVIATLFFISKIIFGQTSGEYLRPTR